MSAPIMPTSEERAKRVRQLTHQAIQCALQSRWNDAITTNLELLKLVQRNAETLNRLGKAYFELGRYDQSKRYYGESLEIDPANAIARKNLDRLELMGEQIASEERPAERIDPRLFIEEIGKTGLTNLVNLGSRDLLAKLIPGDQVYLLIDGNTLFVRNGRGETIGQVEPVLATRLIRFMKAGNQYAAAITELNNRLVRIIIRETFQHPTQIGKVSFLPATAGSGHGRSDSFDASGHDDDDALDDEDDDDLDDGDDEADESGDVAEDTEIGGEAE